MGKEIKFSLVFRDMWQSAGKYQPRVDQLTKVAPAIIKMGCFDRVETNGGGFEQVNLLFGENPNKAVREWTKPFHEAGIQTHMLDRALNALRMSPCPKDLRRLFYKVKKAQGTDITRIFCGLNDPRNVIPSIQYAKEAGMIAQASLCITHSPIHTVEYYINLAKTFIDAGADEICLKDMAGIGRPESLGKICKGIKEYKKDIIVQYHSHAGPGFNMASILEVARGGCDYIDTAVAPLSWGTGHADIIAVQEMLKDAGFKVKDINMEAYMEVRTQIQEMMDDFLGYYIPALNHLNNSLLIKPGLPGGMMGSLMTDLEDNLKSLNKWKVKNGQPELTTDQLLVKLFDEVAYVWPKVGYPCLVTPFSQYVKNLALMNVMQMEKGKERWSMIADTIWDMILGKSGQLPGPVDKIFVDMAKAEGREFLTSDPQENYPDDLDTYRQKMAEKGWELGEDEEELFEYAMHPQQYEAYKSGAAKAAFEKDLAERKSKKNAPAAGAEPKQITVTVNGQSYKVDIAYGAQPAATPSGAQSAAPAGEGLEILSPLEGKAYLVSSSSETPKKVGDHVNEGDIICYIEAMKVFNRIKAEKTGTITSINFTSGDSVEEDDVLMTIA
ncbi:MAG: biotin/lipoyl-containing protein [Prevotellaceae bacterium]|nr:biotin/lipoyl-containing protein [Prevotellaceae bacterium]MDO4931170.1 biotin/lipoyl-containing protein [Prevotellaceae bacterium]